MSMNEGGRDLGEYLRDMLAEEEADPEMAPPSDQSARVDGNEPDLPVGDAAADKADPTPATPDQGLEAAQTTADVAWWGMTVGHLTLAIPGEAVEFVEAWREPEPLPEMPQWVVGQLKVKQALRWVLDPAGLILPAEHFRAMGEVGRRAQGLLHLADTGLSLVSASTPEAVSVPSEQVRWRREKGERPWMAGTLREQGLVLVDPSGLIETSGL